MATCPNKNLQAWKTLVAEKGENMAYYLWDKNKGNVGDIMFQLKGKTEISKASPEVIKLMKDFLNRIGVGIQTLQDVSVNGLKQNANGAAMIMQRLVQVVSGMEDVALPEEAMHFAVEIIKQKDPALFNKLLSEIGSYRIYKAVLDDYSSSPLYQTPDGKPNIRKLKEEAIAKLLAEKIIFQRQGYSEKPENLAKVESWWQQIVDALKRLFTTSGFDEASMSILTGKFTGSAEDLRSNEVFLQQGNTIQEKIVNTLRSVHARMAKPKTEDGKYTIDGKEIAFRVSNLSKTWYDNRFADKDLIKSDYAKAIDEQRKEKGTDGHADLENMLKKHFVDADGKFIKDEKSRPSDAAYTSRLNPYDRTMYELLKTNMAQRLASFPDGTIFMAETMIYDPKRDLAGTVDFIAVEPGGKTHLLDWKFMDISLDKTRDVPWYKVGAWKIQMKNYKNILKYAYGVTFDGTEQTRMIPIRAMYTKGDKRLNIKPQLYDLEIGDINLKSEERAYLLPVGLEEERTGDKRIDALIEKLNSIYDTISSKKAPSSKKREKAEQLNELYGAIRQLQVRQNIKPLIAQAGVINKEIVSILRDYRDNWKGKPIDAHSRKERNDFASRIMLYENTLSVYTTLYKNLKGVFDFEMTNEEEKLKEALRKVSDDANDLENELEEVRKDFAENVVAKSENVMDFLKPEKIISGLTKWFGTTTTLQLSSVQVLYKMANRAFTMAAMDTVEQGNILKKLKADYDAWAKSRGLSGKDYYNLIKKTDKNELIDEFNPEFYKMLKSEINDKNRQWVRENIDVEEYRKFLKQYLQEEYDRIERKTRWGTQEEIDRAIAIEKIDADKLYTIGTDESPGWLLYDLAKKFPKREKWESKEWKELHKAGNEPALKVYNYIKERNEHFDNIGYINARQSRVFLPFVRKSLMEKLVMGGQLKVGEGLLRAITVSEGDVGLGDIDPITKQPVFNIPKYFTKDTGEEVSDDLFKNLTLLNEMASRYEYLTEIEEQLNLIVRTESNKEAIKTSYFGKTKYKADGDPETTSDNSDNTQLVRNMMEAIVYGHKFVEDQNFDMLLGGLGNFGKRANKVLGVNIFPEQFDKAQVSLNKSINWMNNAFQLTRLGLNPLSAFSNLAGGSFQSFINAGTYFTKTELLRNEFLITGRMNGVDGKKYMAALQYFLPLTENYNTIIAKELSASKFSQEGVQDALMILMRKSDQYVQTVNFFSYLDNTVIIDGKLLNAREYIRDSEKYKGIYSLTGEMRKKMNDEFEKDVKDLIEEKGVMKNAKFENGELTIPGIERKSDTVIEMRRKVQGITKTALGNLSEDDLRLINLNIVGKSFMIFKNWIPRLVDVRFGNLKYNTATEAYEWGRTRMMYRFMSENLLGSLSNLTSALLGNDQKWVEQMRALYEAKKADYERDTGKTLNMTEEQFMQLVHKNVVNQATDFLFYLTLTMMLIAAKAVPPDDEDKATQNRYRYMLRAMDKVRDEVAYFYNPTSFLNLTKSGIFPSVQLLDNFGTVFNNFVTEMYALGVGDEKKLKKNYVVKYLLKGGPVTSQADLPILLFFPDLAKDLGMRAQSESRPLGR